METFKLESKFKPIKERICGNCAFATQERLPQQLVTSLVCHAAPPSLVSAPTPDGRGFQVLAMFPVMKPEQFCYVHRYPAELEIPGGSLGNLEK